MFRAGQQIGIYTLINRIGRGGFGEVWLAERRAKFVTTKVAVKLPHDEQVDHEAIKQEATLWEQASGHPNILPIIDADEYDGQIVIVSEYAPDGSLEEWLNKNGKMTLERAAELSVEILAGLEFLHARKIIHRDLKPANILLQGNTPRLTDFGISRALRTTIASQSQFISGTFAYMSPEALDGKRSVQTDIWAVGVNLYRFLTGDLPFPQKEPSVLFPAIIMREYEPLPESVPDALRQIVAKALSKQPADRYQSAGQMRADLIRFLRRDSQPLPIPVPAPPPPLVKVPVASETETAVRPAPQVVVLEKKDDSRQAASPPDEVKPRKLEIEIPESTRQRVKRLLILTESTRAFWGPTLLWSTVGLISGFLCWLTWQHPIAFFAPGVVFGITAYFFAEYSSSPLIRRRRRFLAIPLLIVLSAIGFYVAFIAFVNCSGLGWGYFVWGIVWSTFLVLGELLCWRFKLRKLVYAPCMVVMSGLSGFISYAIAGANALPVFLISQPLVLITHVIAFGKGTRELVSTTGALVVVVAIWASILAIPSSENSDTYTSTNTNYSATPMATAEPPRSVQLAQAADGFYQQKNYAAAERNYREAIKLEPSNDVYHNALANSLYGLGRYKEAESEYRLAASLKPGTAGYHENLGDALFEQERYNEAAGAYQDTINIETLNYRYYNKLGNCLINLERYPEAEEQYRRAISLKSDVAQSHGNLGNSLIRQKRYVDAETPLREAIRLDSNYYDYHNDLGVSLYGQGKYADAETSFRNSIRLRSNGPIVHSNLGDSLLEQNKCSQAELSYERALKLDPNNSSFKAKLEKTRARKAALFSMCS